MKQKNRFFDGKRCDIKGILQGYVLVILIANSLYIIEGHMGVLGIRYFDISWKIDIILILISVIVVFLTLTQRPLLYKIVLKGHLTNPWFYK